MTDGLSDNVFDSEMVTGLRFARAGETEDEQVQKLADHIVDYAQVRMRCSVSATPYERGAGGILPLWKKPDDTTVIVALVCETYYLLFPGSLADPGRNSVRLWFSETGPPIP